MTDLVIGSRPGTSSLGPIAGKRPIASVAGFYRSAEVCSLTGATYRQIDYWNRTGKLLPDHEAATPGSGYTRLYSLPTVVLVRAYVVASSVIDPGRVGGGLRLDDRFNAVPVAFTQEMAVAPALSDRWLVIEADSVRIVKGDWPTDGALFVDLAAARRYVTEGISATP